MPIFDPTKEGRYLDLTAKASLLTPAEMRKILIDTTPDHVEDRWSEEGRDNLDAEVSRLERMTDKQIVREYNRAFPPLSK